MGLIILVFSLWDIRCWNWYLEGRWGWKQRWESRILTFCWYYFIFVMRSVAKNVQSLLTTTRSCFSGFC